ncbi:MAG: hypothetical protein WBE80_14305 [Methylocella sp.]
MVKAPVSSAKADSEKKPPTPARPEVTLVSESLAGQFNPAHEFHIAIYEAVQAAATGPFKLNLNELGRNSAIYQAAQECARSEFARIGESLRTISTGWAEAVAKQRQVFSKIIAPALEETRIRKRISDLGFVPHAILFKHLGNVEKPSYLTIDEFSQALADEVWPKVKASLQLSIEDCLGDLKIFRTFDEIIRAHEAGLYQLTAPSAFFVIERAARLAQQDLQKPKKTIDWLATGVGGLQWDALSPQWRRGWRVWAVLCEHSFSQCWADASADDSPYPQRHAAAHGYGTKVYSAVDSMNNVLLAHFVIIAASAFQANEREQPVKTSEGWPSTRKHEHQQHAL